MAGVFREFVMGRLIILRGRNENQGHTHHLQQYSTRVLRKRSPSLEGVMVEMVSLKKARAAVDGLMERAMVKEGVWIRDPP